MWQQYRHPARRFGCKGLFGGTDYGDGGGHSKMAVGSSAFFGGSGFSRGGYNVRTKQTGNSSASTVKSREMAPGGGGIAFFKVVVLLFFFAPRCERVPSPRPHCGKTVHTVVKLFSRHPCAIFG